MTQLAVFDRARLREPGSVILREFRAAMEWQRAQRVAAIPRPGARSFEAADTSAFTAGMAQWGGSINSVLMGSHATLVARSRRWARNTGMGRRFMDLVRNNGVGPVGYTLQMRCGDWRQEKGRWVFRLDKLANDAIEAAWIDWCKRGNCEASGRLSFADVCKVQMETAARDGEYLARHLVGTRESRYRYQLQLLSPDRLDLAHNVTPVDGADVVMGVHRNSAGRAVAYSILRHHPGDAHSSRMAEVVPAAQVLHDFITLDAEQARGVPWTHAVLLGANMLSQFQNFAVYAAQAGASQMGFFTQPAEQPMPIKTTDLGAADNATTGELAKEMAPGALDLLPPGIDFKPFVGQYPSETFDPFVASFKRDMAAGVGVANHNLTGDMEAVNYSSARIAELAERDHWKGIAHWFLGSFVEPVFRQWLEMALLSNQVTLASGQPLSVARIDKYLAGATFRGRGWDWVDPLKEVSAAKLAREELFTTRSQIIAAKGGDFEDNVIEAALEAAILEANGIKLQATQPAPQPSKPDVADKPAPAADPNNPDEVTTNE